MWKRHFFLLLAVLLLTAPAGAQDGRGVIREGTVTPISELSTLNPLFCSNVICIQVTNLLFPFMMQIDTESVTHIPSTGNDTAPVSDWDISDDGMTYTLTVRDDLTWSDGTPITSTDALFSIAAATNEDLGTIYYSHEVSDLIASLSTPDEQTLVVEFTQPTCSGLHRINFPIIPAHPFDSEFAANYTANYDFTYIRRHPFNVSPVTAGRYELEEIRAPEFVRLRSGEQGYEFVYMPSAAAEVEAFLEGELNYLPSFNDADLPNLRAANAQIKGGADHFVYTLMFNLADPTDSRSWNTDDEEGQGIHPIFGDIRVRQAVQLGININELLTVAAVRRGTPVNALAFDNAWYINDTVASPDYDFRAAAQFLNEAGWRDTNGDGLLECRACETAPIGTTLQIRLNDTSGTSESGRVAFILERQLERLGFRVDSVTGDVDDQRFDLALTSTFLGYPYNPIGTFAMFETTEDRVNSGANVMSYSNPRVDELLQSAATSNCMNQEVRAEAYQEVQAILANDLPYMPLFAPHVLYAASDGIFNFEPFALDPLWNVDQWQVTDARLTP